MKKRIIFVDDEPNVLKGLERMLRGMRKEWDMTFAESGQEALEKLEQAEEPFDVIVSDMRMPGMDGAQLLTEVMNRYPGMVRIVLSGQSEREMILKSVGPTHQYLTKPCDADTLKTVVSRASALRELLDSGPVKNLASQLESLPSMPTLYFEVMEELRKPESSVGKIGEIISKDVAMTAKILQLVNSAFFGLPQRISNPAQAANLLGIDIIRALVLSTHVFSQFKQTGIRGFAIEDLWDHSGATGVCAKEICKLEVNDKKMIDDAFMAGILHDVGMLVLAYNSPEKYSEAIMLTKTEKMKLPAAEMQVFGATHAEVGGYLLGLWGLPDPIVEAVFFHHSPSKNMNDKFSTLTAVHIASAIEASARRPGAIRALAHIDKEYVNKVSDLEHLKTWKQACDAVLNRAEEEDDG